MKIIKLSPLTFKNLRDFIYNKSGIFFPEGKLYLLESRLGRRLRSLNLDSFEEYFTYIRKISNQQEELIQVFNEITINETFFYRYDKQLNAFSKKLLPEILKSKMGKKNIRIWSAASSSGEELYTLGMILKEQHSAALRMYNFDILGTDISEKILAKARAGVYTKNSFRGTMPAVPKTKYFKPVGNNFQISQDIKDLIKFDNINLTDTGKIRKLRGLDFVFIRNVLIYFDEKVKKQVIRSIYDVLNHGGYLFLGEAESLHGISSAFKVVHFPGAFVYKKE